MLDIFLAFSLHTAPGYNFVHPHIRYRSEHLIAGAYYNSVRRPSFYLGGRTAYGRAWVEYGMVTGYKYAVVPMLRTGYTVTERINLFASPSYDRDAFVGIVGIEYTFF